MPAKERNSSPATPGKRLRLRRLRKQRGWKQEDVAGILGISESYYGMIETGARTPNLVLGHRIARLFNTTVDELFFSEDVEKPDVTSVEGSCG